MIPEIIKTKEFLQQSTLEILTNHKSIHETFLKLEQCFHDVNRILSWIEPFSVSIQPAKEHVFLYEQYFAEALLRDGILITQSKEEKFLFYFDSYWYIDDDDLPLSEISIILTEWTAFSDPHSVMGIKKLIDQNFWKFDLENLPKISGEMPKDTLELASWDDKRVLHGTSKENALIMTREEWDLLVKREGERN